MFPHRNKVLIISCIFYAAEFDTTITDNAYIEAINFRQLAIKRWTGSKQFLITNNKRLTNVTYVNDKDCFLSLLSKLVQDYSTEYDILFTLYSNEPTFNLADGSISNAFYDKMNTNCFSLCLTQTDTIHDLLDLQWQSTNGKVFSMSDNLNNFKNVNSYSIHYNMSPDPKHVTDQVGNCIRSSCIEDHWADLVSGSAQPDRRFINEPVSNNILVHLSSFCYKFNVIDIERFYFYLKKDICLNYLMISRC